MRGGSMTPKDFRNKAGTRTQKWRGEEGHRQRRPPKHNAEATNVSRWAMGVGRGVQQRREVARAEGS